MKAARKSSAHADRARAKKVHAMGECLWERLTHEERCSQALPALLEAFTPSQRAALARGAAQREPSDETWALLVAWVRQHVRWARRGAA